MLTTTHYPLHGLAKKIFPITGVNLLGKFVPVIPHSVYGGSVSLRAQFFCMEHMKWKHLLCDCTRTRSSQWADKLALMLRQGFLFRVTIPCRDESRDLIEAVLTCGQESFKSGTQCEKHCFLTGSGNYWRLPELARFAVPLHLRMRVGLRGEAWLEQRGWPMWCEIRMANWVMAASCCARHVRVLSK